jgi:probable addiction module antidote protein
MPKSVKIGGSEQRSLVSVAKFLNTAFEACDIDRMCQAIGAAAKTHNISELARISGVKREIIHRSFAGRGAYPNLASTARLLGAMALRLEVVTKRINRLKTISRQRSATRSVGSETQGGARFIASIPDFLNEAFKSEDLDRICQAVGAVAKTLNIAEVARMADIAETTVHRGFAGGGAAPNLTTIVSVLGALGLRLKVAPRISGKHTASEVSVSTAG